MYWLAFWAAFKVSVPLEGTLGVKPGLAESTVSRWGIGVVVLNGAVISGRR
jgi:hypothetical protein